MSLKLQCRDFFLTQFIQKGSDMDLVTRNLLDSFRKQQTFSNTMDEATLFEHFANYCVVAKEYSEEFEVEDVHVAGSNDLQLDGAGIIVNGVIIDSTDEVDDLARTNKYLDAEFIFVQAKTGSDFSGESVSNMFFGIRDIFADKPSLPRNERLVEKERILRHIYKNSTFFRHGNPFLRIYYVTTGKWQDDEKLRARVQTEVTTLEDLSIFRKVVFNPVDAKKLQQLFNSAQNALTKTVTFANRVTLPAMDGVREAYLGYLPASEYLAMITDDNGNLLRGLFYENVRDFQGSNPVNREIEETIRGDESHTFVLLNNGITIVSEDLRPTGNRFSLSGFQIVNGCQTSHVLYNNRDRITESVLLPVKLIVKPKDSLKNQVIKATNRQTVVKTEELSALTDFQKHLEQYYDAVPEEHGCTMREGRSSLGLTQTLRKYEL